MPGASDARIAWIQQRVILGLGLNETEFQYMLDETPAKQSSDGSDLAAAPRLADILREFLGAKAGVGSSLFFHVEKENVEDSEEYDEEFQESEADVQEGNQQLTVEAVPEGEDAGTVQDISPTESKPLSEDGVITTPDGPKALDPPSADELAVEARNPEVDQAAATNVRLVTKTRKAIRTVLVNKRRCRLTQGSLPDYVGRVMYFVKIMGGEVARLTSTSDHAGMTTAMEYGCLAGDCLTNLSAAIKEVFTPLLDHQLGLGVLAAAVAGLGDKASPDSATAIPQDTPKVGDNLRNEFRANLHKFESQVTNATQQVKGDVHLSVPNINIDDPDIGNDFEAVSLLEGAMEEWSRLIAAVVEAENLKRVKGKGPMAEIEFWRRRNASLSALYEQINMPKVNFVMSRVCKGKCKLILVRDRCPRPTYVYRWWSFLHLVHTVISSVNMNRVPLSPPKGPENVEGDGRSRSTHASDLQLPLLRAVEAIY